MSFPGFCIGFGVCLFLLKDAVCLSRSKCLSAKLLDQAGHDHELLGFLPHLGPDSYRSLSFEQLKGTSDFDT